jgi:Carboxypeptidase regulatory-like domain
MIRFCLRSPQNRTMRVDFYCALLLLSGVIFFSVGQLFAQDTPAAPVQQPAPSPESSSAKNNSAQSGSRHSDDFLVRGTVFTAEGLALPGAELRLRRSSEHKPHWETTTNSRGNFAVRVKMGADYEVTVRAKGFQEQSLPVNAKTGERFKDLVFRLQHSGGKKS